MDIKFTQLSDIKLYVKPSGRIDTTTAVEFGTSINDNIDDIVDLVIDFSEVEYISSMGLRMLLELQKRMNTQGSMTLIKVSQDVLKIFEITGFNKILKIV